MQHGTHQTMKHRTALWWRLTLAFTIFLATGPWAGALAQDGQRATRQRPPPLAIGAAFGPDGTLWTVGLDAQRRLVLQSSADHGRQWSEPRALDIGQDSVSADGENRPKIAFGPKGIVVVSYTRPGAKPFTGDIRLLRSTDGGTTFAPAVTVHHDRAPITHRFESIAFDEDGVLHTVWIDKRDQESAKAQGRPYRAAAIYRNESRDGGLTFGPDTRVADHSCECCRIALAPAPGGGMAAMWRHVFDPNERDHAFAAWSSRSKAHSPVIRATNERWALDACPHHGPGLSPASDGTWHAVAYGIQQGQSAVRYSRLDAQGRPIAQSVRALPDADAEHADVWALGGQVVIVWRRFDGQRFWLRAWVSSDGGRTFALRDIAQTALANDQPRLIAHQGRAWVVWRDVERTRVEEVVKPSAPLAVEAFDGQVFSLWRSSVRRPTWVAFTATWCAVCPAVIADLQRAARAHPHKPEVWTVVVDVAPGDDDARLLREPHLRQSDRLYAFDGMAQAIRHAVDPSWRGAVPFVALLDAGGAVRTYTGRPPDRDLRASTTARP